MGWALVDLLDGLMVDALEMQMVLEAGSVLATEPGINVAL